MFQEKIDFHRKKVLHKFNDYIQMNNIIRLHLKESEFTYRACKPFTRHCQNIQKFREICNLKHLYRRELEKAFFTHDAAYSDLANITISDKILKDRFYEIARNCKYDGYQRALASIVYKVFLIKNRIRSECT